MEESNICQVCKVEFDQKSDFDKHLNKKKLCIIKEAVSRLPRKKPVKKDDVKDTVDYSYLRLPDNVILIESEQEDNKVKSSDKKNILKYIDKGHNYLYNSENIEGEDALNDIMNWLFIKSMQPILSDKKEDGKIDLLDKKYYSHLYDDDDLDEIFSYFKDLQLLANQPLDSIRKMTESNDIIRRMGDILKIHPMTSQIFNENNFIKAKKAPTIQGFLREVINKINITDLEDNEDVIGEIYEHIINGYVKKGSKLGQFFTPRPLMKLTFELKKNRINEIIKKLDKKEKIKFYDSCMGTGGWLVTGYNLLKEKYGDRILLSGGEVKSTTFQYGLMNLILTLKKFPHDVKCESSLTHINANKHHFILTNPPFQTDKKFDQIKENFKSDDYTRTNKIKLDDVYDLKDNSPPIQFLELDMFKLEENGMCLIILPYGELFFGASNKDSRKHFMKKVNITDIILFAGATFTHTGIKTCALIFEKDKTGTKFINFIQANKECNTLTKITTVSINDIEKEPNNSWYVRDYLKDEYIDSLSSKMTNFEWVEFGNIFTLEKGKLQSSKVEEDEDGITFLTGAKDENFKKVKKNELSYIDGENIFISPNGNGNKRPIKYFIGECNYSDLMAVMILNDIYKTKINKKYIYYLLKSLQEHIENTYQKGSCNLSLDQKNFNRMKIPIPTLEEQTKIIQNIMELEDSKKDIIKGIEANNKMRRMYMEAMIKGATNKGINKIMRLGEVCEHLPNGKRKSSEGLEYGKYPLYYCSINNILYMDEYDFNDEAITMNITNGSGKCNLFHARGKYSVAETTLHFKSKNEKIIKSNILFNYLLLIKYSICKIYKGTHQMSINKEDFNNKIMVLVPSLDYQNKMEQTLNNFDGLDEGFNKMLQEIEDNSKTAFLNSLDDYGNPNSFNIDKILQSDSEEEKEEIKVVVKSKSKTKSKSKSKSIPKIV